MTPSLRELQQAFAAGVLEQAPAVLAHVRDGVFPAARHLQVYRNNTFANLTEALAAIYPVVQRLVGVDFFDQAAAPFIRRHPPRGGNLHDFGGDFAGFVTDYTPAKSLAYLPDVARLEWAWHEAFHAADAPALTLETLATVAPENYGALVFQLHPSARLLTSRYPVQRIWQVNQPGFDDDVTVNLDQGGERLLVRRRDLTVEIAALSEGEYALLRAFADAQPLGAATDVATEAEPDFDLMQTLYRHIQATTLVGFSVYI